MSNSPDRMAPALDGRWQRILEQLRELVSKSGDPIAWRATTVALLHHKVPGVSWTGFYTLRGGELLVESYQGPLACIRLEAHTGVCWAAIKEEKTIMVPDVEKFPGHIPCDSRTRAEIVVPFRNPEGKICGVLDVDSHRPGHFDSGHAAGYEAVIRLLETS